MKYEIYFDNLQGVIHDEVAKANETVKIAMAWLNFTLYGKLFENLLENKVALSIILDDNWVNQLFKEKIEMLKGRGADINFLKMPTSIDDYGKKKTNIMHHKFAIIDDRIILNGSFNWSENAGLNFENLSVISGHDYAVQRFNDEFDFLKRMDEGKIKDLQILEDCPADDCDGKLFNLLLYDPTNVDNYEMYGNVYEVCSNCPYDHYELLESGVSDRFFNNVEEHKGSQYDELFDKINSMEKEISEEEKKNLINEIDNYIAREYIFYLNRYGYRKTENHTVHAIGKLKQEKMLNKHEDPDWIAEIYWKEKFASKFIDDDYDFAFDMR